MKAATVVTGIRRLENLPDPLLSSSLPSLAEVGTEALTGPKAGEEEEEEEEEGEGECIERLLLLKLLPSWSRAMGRHPAPTETLADRIFCSSGLK